MRLRQQLFKPPAEGSEKFAASLQTRLCQHYINIPD
jgi:hypothetical protein